MLRILQTWAANRKEGRSTVLGRPSFACVGAAAPTLCRCREMRGLQREKFVDIDVFEREDRRIGRIAQLLDGARGVAVIDPPPF